MGLGCTVPMAPPVALNPNRAYRRGGHYPRRQAAALLREATWASAWNHRPTEPITGYVVVRAKISWPKQRHRVDYDAAVAVLKPVLDGLTDAQWWRDDRQVSGVIVEQETGHPTGQIEVYVERPTGAQIAAGGTVSLAGMAETEP